MRTLQKLISKLSRFYRMSMARRTLAAALAVIIAFTTAFALIMPADAVEMDVAESDPAIVVETRADEPEAETEAYEETEDVDPDTEAEEETADEEFESETETETEIEAEGEIEAESEIEDEIEDEVEEEIDDEIEDEIEDETLTETEADPEDETETEAPSDTAAAGELYFEGDDYEITVKYSADANIPADAYLEVSEIKDASGLYKSYMNEAEDALLDAGDAEITFARFFDISILCDDEEVQPEAPVEVIIDLDDSQELTENTQVNALHFTDDMPDVLDVNVNGTDTQMDGVSFEAESFSVYGVVGTEVIKADFLSHTGYKYEVTVTYGPEANIPEGSTLSVTDIEDGTDEYDYAMRAVLADKKENGEIIDINRFHMAALDISILDPDGNEIEPEATVQVDIKIKDLPGVDDLSDVEDTLEIQHHVETDDGIVIETVFDGKTEGTYDLKNSEQIAEKGTAVDPDSVSVSDFEPEPFDPTDLPAVTYEAPIEIEFVTPVFSTYTITWGGGGANNTTTTVRWRTGNNNYATTRAQMTVHYVDQNGNPITRPNGINANYDINVGNGTYTNNLDINANTLARAIAGYTYQSAYTVNNGNRPVTRVTATRTSSGGLFPTTTNTVTYYNGNTSVRTGSSNNNNYNAGDLYLVYSGTNANSATVHYGYMDGGSFVEFDDGIPAFTPTFDGNRAFLIYDVEGYSYDSTHLNSATGTSITPLLNVQGDNHSYYNNGNWTTFNAGTDIYVVYEKETEPTQGGTAVIETDEEWPEDDGAPQFSKTSKHTGDGTNTVSLSITAAEKPVEATTPADVIVVFDISGSMDTNMSGQTRLARAKTAVNTMANTLLSANDDVRMALVTFSNSAAVARSFTDNYNTFRNSVNALDADGGTNWEQALQLANTMEVRDDAATFVVFVTDGDPTFRISRGEVADSDLDMYTGTNYQYYRSDNVFGTGNSDDEGLNFGFAVDQVAAISGSNKNFYAIGISNDVTKVRNLTTQGGVSADHAFIASDGAAMDAAFKSITESIKSALGFGDVGITDGVTELTNLAMKVMHSVDVDSFRYYRYGGGTNGDKYGADEAHKTEWTTREADGCAPASYNSETGAVEWNMGEGFQLEDGVTYVLTFVAWPSQEAYDLIADLNNGIKVYEEGHPNSITDEEREQIVENAPPTATTQGSYALKTNTDKVEATYSQTTKTGDTVTVSGEQDISADYHPGDLENMDLESMKLTVKKEFEDDLTAGEDRETQVTLHLKRRNAHQNPAEEFVDYPVPQGGTLSDRIVLNEDNNWTYSLYVAPGFEVDGEVLEHGYDFTITEPDIDYHYTLIEEIINPMVVDGEDAYYGDGYLIKDEETIQKYVDRSLTAINRVKSGLDIKKIVYDADGETEIFPDTEFTITGKLLDADGNPYTWQEGDSVDNSGAYHKYDKDGNRIIYKGHFADSSNITFTLKAGESIRFVNVPDGTTFEFTESVEGMEALGYEWMSTEAVTQHKISPDSEEYTTEGDVQPDVSGRTASLKDPKKIVGNKQYEVTYSNKRIIAFPEVELVKVDALDSTVKLNAAEFKLYKDADKTEEVTVDADGKEIKIVTGNKEDSEGPDGWYDIGTLPPGTYYLYETVAPDHYELDETPVIITITAGTSEYTVTATKNGESVLSKDAETGIYTITVDNDRLTRWIRIRKTDMHEDPIGDAVFELNTGSETLELTSYAPDTTVDGVDVSGLLADSDGVYTFELPHAADAYVLKETDAPDGYYLLSQDVNILVTLNSVTAMSADGVTNYNVNWNKEEGAPAPGSEENPYVITIPNSAGVELPSTGGPGTILYTLGGMMLLMSAALMYGFRVRRRERRL